MPPKIPSLAVADLSTAHMSLKDNEFLRDIANSGNHKNYIGRVIPHEYGYLVSLHYDDCVYTQAAWIRAMRLAGFSLTFTKVCRACKKAKFAWICFDRDADTVDGLPTEAW